MPQVYICNRCAEKIDGEKQDWVIVSMDTAGASGLEIRVHAECEVIEARRSKSRPGRGLVRTRVRVVKQDGTTALVYTPLRMVKCRSED